MADDLDAVLTRWVASEVATAPLPPTAEEVAAHVPSRAGPAWYKSRRVLAIAAALVLVAAIAAVVIRHQRFTSVATDREPMTYLLPTWPTDLQLSSAQPQQPIETATGSSVHVFQPKTNGSDHGGLIVLLVKATPVAPTQPTWIESGNGTGELSFTLGNAGLEAFTRGGISEADARAFATGLRVTGPSARDGLKTDPRGEFAEVATSLALGAARAIERVSWREPSSGAEITLTLQRSPHGLKDVEMLPVAGAVRTVNGLRVVEAGTDKNITHHQFRVANWLEPDGTWVTVAANYYLDVDHIVASLRRVDADTWAKAIGLSASAQGTTTGT